MPEFLKPSGYFAQWVDAFSLLRGHHLRVNDGLEPVCMIAWDSLRLGMGKRARSRGDYLLILQKPPVTPRDWHDHRLAARWAEKADRRLPPHAKPVGLLTRLIATTTEAGDLIVDPAAGSFTTMAIALELGRNFVGGDLAVPSVLADRAQLFHHHHRKGAEEVITTWKEAAE